MDRLLLSTLCLGAFLIVDQHSRQYVKVHRRDRDKAVGPSFSLFLSCVKTTLAVLELWNDRQSSVVTNHLSFAFVNLYRVLDIILLPGAGESCYCFQSGR